MSDSSSERVQIDIPKELYNKIQEKIKNTFFISVEEYIIVMIKSDLSIELIYTKEEQEFIAERLREHGYVVVKKDDV